MDRPNERTNKPVESARPARNGLASALVKQSPQAILARYADGETIKDIAHSYGLVKGDRVYAMLLKKCPEEWAAHQAARALRILEESRDDLETARDPLALARARERNRSCQWELSRVFRRLYGDDVVPQSNQAPTLQITIKVNEPDTVVIDSAENSTGGGSS